MQTIQVGRVLLTLSIVAIWTANYKVECVVTTLKEFQHTLKIVHDVCQTVTKVPEANIDQVKSDNFIEDEMTKCFVHCTLEMLHLIEGTVGQFHVAGQHTDYIIPEEMYQTTIKAFGHCETITNGMTDNCEAGYTMLKCFREGNKEFWIP